MTRLVYLTPQLKLTKPDLVEAPVRQEDRDKRFDALVDSAKNKSISRRQFMEGATALGATAAVASSLWANKAAAATPRKGGHLRAALVGGNTIDNMNQAEWGETVMISIGRATRDSLVEVAQDNSAAPALAESWETNDSADTWRFKLRPGVEFSNGKSVTAEDVIASVNVHRGEDTKSGAKGVFAGIEDVTADGDVVVFKLGSPNADFPFVLTDYHMNVVPAPGGVANVTDGIGTGLYTIKHFEPGVRADLERNPNAWQQDSFGFVDSAEILVVSDPNSRQNALVTGEADAINKPELKTLRLLARQPTVEIIEYPSTYFYTAPMLMDTAPFSNKDFRHAIKYGIDREEFVQKIIYGFGTPGNDQPIGPGFKYHAADIPQFTYDPEKAKHHLKKSGHEGITVSYSGSEASYPGSVDFGILMRETLAPIGIEVDVVREPADGFWVNVWNKKPWVATYWGARPVEDMILSINYTSDAPWNDTRIAIPELDQLVIAARGELDEKKRAEMYRDIQVIISQEGGTIVPAYGQEVAAVASRVGTTGSYGSGWEMDGGHFIKRWWLTG